MSYIFQKYLDIHRDHFKFNRKAKIKKLPQNYDITLCGELYEIFPNAFDSTHIYNPQGKLLRTQPDLYIWEMSYSGKMFFDILKYKFAWTLYFRYLNEATDYYATPFGISEFSMRIYSPGKGYGPWQKEGLEVAADIYEQLLSFYDISY